MRVRGYAHTQSRQARTGGRRPRFLRPGGFTSFRMVAGTQKTRWLITHGVPHALAPSVPHVRHFAGPGVPHGLLLAEMVAQDVPDGGK